MIRNYTKTTASAVIETQLLIKQGIVRTLIYHDLGSNPHLANGQYFARSTITSAKTSADIHMGVRSVRACAGSIFKILLYSSVLMCGGVNVVSDHVMWLCKLTSTAVS